MHNGALHLEDGSIFLGRFLGYPAQARGEIVFSTGMVGYPQSLTDPSYEGQILVFTYPLIGNYGIPDPFFLKNIIQNFESERIHVRGLIVSSLVQNKFHWQAKKTLNDWLWENRIPCLEGVDTRSLTQRLREKGVMLGRISNLKVPRPRRGEAEDGQSSKLQDQKFIDPNRQNLVTKVSCDKPIIYKNGTTKILLIDCGVKAGILRELFNLGTTIIRVPWNFKFEKTRGVKTTGFFHKDIDGVVITNGPGDARMLPETIETIRKILEKKIPTLGICLGNQLMCLAAGGQIYKLKYGHRALNQPVILKGTKKAYITSQNHGFAVRMSSLGKNWEEWFVNLNDGTNEGIRHKKLPFMSVQFHPEGNPGPEDTAFIFRDFLRML
jgi:carbamoyl-phosphate synthase small subunit